MYVSANASAKNLRFAVHTAIMETRKGSSTFRIHLARISIDGVDEPVGREATLCLRLQQDQTTIPNLSQQLMDIYIDGRLMVSLPAFPLGLHQVPLTL